MTDVVVYTAAVRARCGHGCWILVLIIVFDRFPGKPVEIMTLRCRHYGWTAPLGGDQRCKMRDVIAMGSAVTFNLSHHLLLLLLLLLF